MRFEEKLIDFFGLSRLRDRIDFYYLGLGAYRRNSSGAAIDSYEGDLDNILAGVHSELGEPPEIRKIGLTRDKAIAEKRQNGIPVIVGDVNNGSYDGVLFIPRPRMWNVWRNNTITGKSTEYVDYGMGSAYSTLAYLISRTTIGLIATDLEKDHAESELVKMLSLLISDLDCRAEIVYSPTRRLKTHLLVRLTL